MCGIVGYAGKENALPILIEGIKSLEYRGYDSAGFAVVTDRGAVESLKAVGRVSRLESKIGDFKEFGGKVGVSHTRWATHGRVSEANAHPHADCKKDIWLAHNGIIENYKELKQKLAAHQFRSETDTETIAHLIEELRDTNKRLSLEDAVMEALRQLQGTYGLVIIDRREPEKLIAARNFSPLLIGIADGAHIVASDASAVLAHTRRVVYLHDGEMAILTATTRKIIDLTKSVIARKPEALEWSIEKAKKGGRRHFMIKEIFDQPEAVENSIRGRVIPREGLVKLGGLARVEKRLQEAKRIQITACGTAYFAGSVGRYLLEELAEIPTAADRASELRYRKPILRRGDVMLAISQSGETADTLASLIPAKENKVLTLGIVNTVGSTIARQTDAGVYQHIGPEIGVASTKAFTSQVAILTLLAVLLGRQRQLAIEVAQKIATELVRIPELMRTVLRRSARVERLARQYRRYKNFLYLGRKYNYPVAMEGALKLKEISYVHAEGYAAGEMKHGPIAMIDRNFPCVFIAPTDSAYEKVVSNIQEVKARNGPVITIATEGNEEIRELVDDVIYIPQTLEMLTPLLSIIPLQLFAYYFGVQKGYDVDKPRNLAKSVTVE